MAAVENRIVWSPRKSADGGKAVVQWYPVTVLLSAHGEKVRVGKAFNRRDGEAEVEELSVG